MWTESLFKSQVFQVESSRVSVTADKLNVLSGARLGYQIIIYKRDTSAVFPTATVRLDRSATTFAATGPPLAPVARFSEAGTRRDTALAASNTVFKIDNAILSHDTFCDSTPLSDVEAEVEAAGLDTDGGLALLPPAAPKRPDVVS